MTKLTQEQKQKISKELIDDWGAFQKAQWLIGKLEEFENYFSTKHELGEKPQSFLTDEELEDIQNPPPNSDLQKVIQIFQNNELGEVLTDLINYEIKVRKFQITSVQSIMNIEGSAKMKNFSPNMSSSTNLRAENIQSISKVKKDLIIEGDFSPSWGDKKTVETTTLKSAEDKYENQLINLLKEKSTLTPTEFDKVNYYLKVKKTLLQTRQQTIEELQKCLNELEKKFGKQTVISEIGNTVSGVGGSITGVITFGIPKAVGEAIKAGSNFSKISLSNKGNEVFQVSLEEEKELIELNQTYKSLTNNLKDEEIKLFKTDYKIYDVFIGKSIWKGRSLTPERMEKVIDLLGENLKTLRIETEEEIKELQNMFGKEKINLSSIQSEDLAKQIKDKEIHLQKLVTVAKDKLKSKSKFSDAKQKERNEKLEEVFQNLPNTSEELVKKIENIKSGLSGKLTREEVNNLCQIQTELENLQVQQAQIEQSLK